MSTIVKIDLKTYSQIAPSVSNFDILDKKWTCISYILYVALNLSYGSHSSIRFISESTYTPYHIFQFNVKENAFCKSKLVFLTLLGYFISFFGNAHWRPQDVPLILSSLGALVTVNIWSKFEVNRTFGSEVMIIC